jgi:hypothetical protein
MKHLMLTSLSLVPLCAAAGLVLVIFLILVPPILSAMARFQGEVSESEVDFFIGECVLLSRSRCRCKGKYYTLRCLQKYATRSLVLGFPWKVKSKTSLRHHIYYGSGEKLCRCLSLIVKFSMSKQNSTAMQDLPVDRVEQPSQDFGPSTRAVATRTCTSTLWLLCHKPWI